MQLEMIRAGLYRNITYRIMFFRKTNNSIYWGCGEATVLAPIIPGLKINIECKKSFEKMPER